jgi:hypothetical protein
VWSGGRAYLTSQGGGHRGAQAARGVGRTLPSSSTAAVRGACPRQREGLLQHERQAAVGVLWRAVVVSGCSSGSVRCLACLPTVLSLGFQGFVDPGLQEF